MPAETAQSIDFQAERVRAFRDVSLLLEFLGQRADSRLQAHFEDTRGDLTAPIGKLAAPPCRTYRHFLNRLIAIGGPLPGLPGASAPGRQPADAASEGDETLSDMAFLYFARDFLAAVAAPATVDTICVTRAYKVARRYSTLSRLLHLRRLRGGNQIVPPDDMAHECIASAKRLAFRVVAIEYGAIIGTVITLIISAYALSGRLILDRQQQISNDYTAIGHEMEALAKDIRLAANTTGAAPSLSASCDFTPSSRPTPINTAGLVDGAATNHGVLAQSEPSMLGEISARHCSLSWRIKRAREDVTAVTLHLVSWTRVVIDLPIISDVFGISRKFIQESADNHADWCTRLDFKPDANGHCVAALQDLLYHTREVADSLLGCIALYVLPALYGCLGAAAATLRALRRKVDLSLVQVTDRGRVQQDVILGLLCGAIIGLFVGYISKATPGEGLGLSALALLAGYNVSGVFAFLDELSKRVFQPAPAGQSDNRAA
jgi:hypothetical protein